MGSRANDVVEGYATLASSLLDRWSTYASKVASKVDAGTYDAPSAAADLGACASLATESSLLWAAEALDAMAILTGREGEPNVVTSQLFRAPVGAALKLTEPLIRVGSLEELPASVVTIQPAQLGPKEIEFTLCADATGYRGGTYVGIVQASTGAPAPVRVNVWITVP
jgi:hypothetical protein